MIGRELANCLRDKLDHQFATPAASADGILFCGPDPKRRGGLLRLLITFEAGENHEAVLPGAVDRAIELLGEHSDDTHSQKAPN